MFRTLKWFFKKPWGLWKVLKHPKETVAWTKAYIISNWYLDIENSEEIDDKVKHSITWFLQAKTGLKKVKS